ncbi:DUF6510 family protein [Isoptericola dokdonensis]|jgi:hypothetical protein|uniref:Uncharacterized protein n=1 Tax=Isoptericola dokdonensis DS-3 TaxID=1300344 RepID=A0A168ESI3_9MICO|nr:DUF6510 family protein [Isoptericola dokdonensis]ANC30417.1 hypothetical protein I598_0842 [Isoptericola dokdonensis DS-3]
MTLPRPLPLDGNAAAGPLAAVLAGDATTATARCAGCGATAVLATAVVYRTAMGTVVRCASCEQVLAVVVERPAGATVSVRGCAWVRVAG